MMRLASRMLPPGLKASLREMIPATVHAFVRGRFGAGASSRPTAPCGWPVAEENRRGLAVGGVSVRRHPYPYRCALAVNNDTDGFRFPAFEAFHAYVSGRGETPFGPGLGLEVADSFWFWASGGEVGLYHAPPWQDDAPASKEHGRLLELARAGWIDSLHGFGAWKEDRHLDRDRVARAIDYLVSKDVRLKVYVNHGGYNMAHNFGGPWGYYQQADNPRHETHCFDLLARYGFKYYWTDVCYELDKFGEDLTFADQEQLDAEVSTHDFERFFRCNDAADYARVRDAFPGLDERGRVEWRRRLFNRVLVPVTARDGRPALVFKRFRGHEGPTAGNFAAQVNPQTLDGLEARRGSVVLYQHFGVWRALFTPKRHASQRYSVPETVLDEHGLWAFRVLAERYREGRILVATTRRLLDFLWMRDNLRYTVEKQDGQPTIRIDAIDCPVAGRIVPDSNALDGLAFELPATRDEPVVVLANKKLPMTVIADPDDSRRLIAYLPWRALEYPE